MSDRELLELAAKAVGIKPGTWFDGWNDEGREAGDHWNPLTDDGDALRLAVKLNITVHSGFTYTPTGKLINCRDHANRIAATRRAIVRAAAEIGKEMK